LDDTGGRAVADKIGSAVDDAIFLHQDVSFEESWPGIIEATERRFGRLDVMVANAGIGILYKAIEMSLPTGGAKPRSTSMACSCQ
jgi:NAD(P)-dependent dehydrogenase (short-subunit alcohol dehydrogenase family)